MVKADETVAMIETDKVTIPVNSPCDAKLVEQHAQVGDTIAVGSDLFTLDIGGDETPAIATSESSLKKHNDKIQPKASSPTDKNHLNAKLGIGNESSKVSGIPVCKSCR
jgi:2-oxoglutarate dehydrogenase E2 component (dihydrolipoamide succinyltransferase)